MSLRPEDQHQDQLRDRSFTTGRSLTRRSVLLGGASVAAAVTGGGLLSGCSEPPSEEVAQANAAVKLPTYKKVTVVDPDLPGDDILLDGYLKYPAEVQPSFDGQVGDGKPITFMTNIPAAIPPAVDKNAFWQELNKRLGSELQITMAPNADYGDKFATMIAGGDLPDVLNIPPGTVQLPALMEAKCTNLTEQLSGDAALNYPNLASLPSEAWRGCVFNGAIYGIPVVRMMSRTQGPLFRADLLAEKGITDPAPANFQEFFDLCAEVTEPKANRWAWAIAPTSYIRQMLGIPNNWQQDGGKFTHAFEAEGNEEAFEAVRRMNEAGLLNPDAFTSGGEKRKEWFGGGTALFDHDSFVAWNQYYADNTGVEGFSVDMLRVPGFDGGEGTPWMGSALNSITAFKKDSEHSVETLLKLADWMATPFGSEEYLFRKYGVEGTHFDFDGTDPIPNKTGVLETGIGLQYICDIPMALYLPGNPEVPERQHALQTDLKPKLINDDSYGLYSEAKVSKGGEIDGLLNDLATQIMLGEEEASAWAPAVQEWRDGGGDQIRSELEQAFAEVNG
jgi:putative aldouronate transport system substrate-binding protein